jgi:hypothetical protein
MLFSQKIGKTPIKTQLQVDGMDQDLRVGLWNLFNLYFIRPMAERGVGISGELRPGSEYCPFLWRLWGHFFKWPLDTLSPDFTKFYDEIRTWYTKAEWYQVYDFIQFVADDGILGDKGEEFFRKHANEVLEREVSGFRFVGTQLTQITDKEELQTIEEAIANRQKTPLSAMKEHLATALAKLSDRKQPDYRNSIKESISAVESLCRVIFGKKCEFGQAIKVVKEKVGLHPALEKAFSSLYGYTSDAGGIRHALYEGSATCDFEDAKYMLVTCSAFVNYLVAKAGKAGIDLK